MRQPTKTIRQLLDDGRQAIRRLNFITCAASIWLLLFLLAGGLLLGLAFVRSLPEPLP